MEIMWVCVFVALFMPGSSVEFVEGFDDPFIHGFLFGASLWSPCVCVRHVTITSEIYNFTLKISVIYRS